MSDEKMPEGALVTVELKIRVPASATYEQVESWLRFNLGDNGCLPGGNPLQSHSIETWGSCGFDWEYTGCVGIREEFDHQETADGERRYKVRHHEIAAA